MDRIRINVLINSSINFFFWFHFTTCVYVSEVKLYEYDKINVCDAQIKKSSERIDDVLNVIIVIN